MNGQNLVRLAFYPVLICIKVAERSTITSHKIIKGRIYKFLWLVLVSCSVSCFLHAENAIFSADRWITVPDGTKLSPFFNPKDCTSNLPWDLLDTVSMAMGEVATESSIHIMPLVTQITFVLSGTLEVVIKEPGTLAPVTHTLHAEQAVLTKPGSLFNCATSDLSHASYSTLYLRLICSNLIQLTMWCTMIQLS